MALPPLYDPDDGDDDDSRRTPVVEKRTTILLSTEGPLLVLVGGARRKVAAPGGAVATTAECRRRRKADRIMLPLDLQCPRVCGWRISRDPSEVLDREEMIIELILRLHYNIILARLFWMDTVERASWRELFVFARRRFTYYYSFQYD